MERQEILQKLNSIFSNVLKNNDIQLSDSTTAADVNGWDSLSNMMLMSDIEKHFAIKFKLTEIMKLKNVGDLVTCISNKQLK
jgi:acyl carrier protein